MSDQPVDAGTQSLASETGPGPEWQVLDGLDPDSAEFPAQSRIGSERILVFRIGDGFRGVERACPHQQRSLHDAFIQGGDTMIRCRWHNYVYRLRDGKGVNCPGYKLRVFEIKRDNGVLIARAVP